MKKLLFTAYSLEMGGIEKALINLLDKIDYSKYKVTLVLEKKEGILLDKVNENVLIKELKVSDHKNKLIRKMINFSRKKLFKLKYHNKYDFSCCYATYSYSGVKLALMASKNSTLYVHSNYTHIYNNKEFYNFFDSRKVDKFRKLIFVSNESKNDFVKKYKKYQDKCLVINNFVDIKDIEKLSKEKINAQKENDTLFVYVGRLEDDSKKLFRQIHMIENIKDTELWIVGDGNDRKKYMQEVIKCKLGSRVKFLGQRENPYPYINQADYVLLTSDYEGFPVIYLEAIALDKEIITTIDVSDDEINMGDYAYIISKDEKEMIKEVKKILKESKKHEKIDLNKLQNDRVKTLEKLFDEVI